MQSGRFTRMIISCETHPTLPGKSGSPHHVEGATDVSSIGVNYEGGDIYGDEDQARYEGNGEGDSKGRRSGQD